MTIRVAVVATAAVATGLLTSACASRGAGSHDQPASGIVDTFTRSGPAIQPSASRSERTGPTCAPGAVGTSFAFSFSMKAKGYATPLRAAVEFSRHNEVSVPPVPAAQWKMITSGGSYSFRSHAVVVSVVRLTNRSWIVDSGTVCG